MRFTFIVCMLGMASSAQAQEASDTALSSSEEIASAAASPPPESAVPWLTQLHWGGGADSNINLSRYGSDPSFLSGFEIVSQVQPSRRLRVTGQAGYDKNILSSVPGAGGAEVFAGYLRPLPATLQLRLSGQLAYRRERSVFADSVILENTSALQSIVENNIAALLAYRFGSFDVEGGVQANLEAHNGNAQDSNLLGANAIAGLRYTLRDRVAFRLRYSYEFSNTRGLSARNLAGGVDFVDRALLLAVSRIRLSARTRIGPRSSVFARYDFVKASDNYSGHLDSHEHVALLATSIDEGSLSLDANVELAHRDFYRRTPSSDNNGSDLTISGGLRADAWILPSLAMASRMGLFGQYRLDVVSAEPDGLIFARHIALVGLVAQLGQGRL